MKLSVVEGERTEGRASERGRVDKPDLRRVNRLSWVLLAFSGLALVNFLSDSGQLRPTNTWANLLVMVIACLLPTIVILIRLSAPYTKAKWWIVTGLVPIALASGYFLLLLMAFYSTPPKLIASIPLKTTITAPTIRCFRNSEFLSTSIDVQREQPILPGVVWSVPLYHQSGGVDVTTKLIDQKHLQCKFAVDEDIDGAYAHKTVTVSLR